MRRHWYLLVALTLAGCGHAPGEGAPSEEKPAAPVTLATVTQQAMEETITAQGTIQPAPGAIARLAPQAAGRLVRLEVKEGDQVTAGQVLAVVEQRVQAAQSQGARAAFRAALSGVEQSRLTAQAAQSEQRSAVTVAERARELALSECDGAVQAAQSELNLARTELAKVLAGARPLEIAQAEASLRQGEVTRARAAVEAERQGYLFEKGVAARRQLDDARAALGIAEGTVDQARQALELLRQGARAEDREAARLRVTQAETALTQAQKTGAARVAQAEAALTQAHQQQLAVRAKEQEVRSARANAGKAAADQSVAEAQTALTVIHAPFAGIVTRRLLNPGDSAEPTTPVVELADLRRLELVASVPADNSTQVRVGQRAHLRFSENQAGEGVVVTVGQVDPQTNLIPLRLQVRTAPAGLRSGTFVQAQIVVRTAPRALAIPRTALLSRDDKRVVFTVREGVAHETVVTVGAQTDQHAEIRHGLTSGMAVVVEGQYELSDGTKVKTVAPETEKADDK